ncbi:MAG: tRNA pseudouridine(38-40) synthase TruA [Epsilonproteobacteria bacterium]|nr:tRNA pseudouridine(38-40) synthase TruA [Campylobacterota bacterium]
MRVKMTLAYDGSQFHGSQIQNSGVETAMGKLTAILKSLGIESKINVSGRTDTGVHATNQVVDCLIPDYWRDLDALKNFINHKALPNLYVKKIEAVEQSFHARFGAQRRVYRYIVSTRQPSVFMTPYILFVSKINEERIQEAIGYFEGEHNFEYFKKSKGGQENFVRKIYKTKFYRYGDYYIFYFEANSFVRSQIRMMVHFLLEVSAGKRTVQELKEQLSCVKCYTTHLAKPNGLYLSRIKY